MPLRTAASLLTTLCGLLLRLEHLQALKEEKEEEGGKKWTAIA